MSAKVVSKLKSQFGDRILDTTNFRGDETVTVALKDWVEVATFLKEDDACDMSMFVDLTAVDWPERETEGEPRFDLMLFLRSYTKKHRIAVRTKVKDQEKAPTLTSIWAGATWPEREVWDMFGIFFKGHRDMRRILLYEEFEGHPLRKDYPIDKAQPLIEYRDVEGTRKLPPFGIEEGQPFARVNWEERLAGRDQQVSPSIGAQVGQQRTLSDSRVAAAELAEVQAAVDAEPPPEAPQE